MKGGFTISSLKRHGRVWNDTIRILHQKRSHQLQRWWAQSSGMQTGVFWPNSWNLGKPSMLLVMSRYCTSSVVHCAVNVRDETSSSCMTTLAPTPLASQWEQLQSWGGNFFQAPPPLPWSSTLRLPSLRVCEGSAAWTTFWAQGGNSESSACLRMAGRESSNSQNAGRNVYKEVAIMSKK
jgi:hypothetical protein